MLDPIVGALIGAAAMIVSAVIGVIGGVYHQEIADLLSRTSTHDYLKGFWNCQWDFVAADGRPDHVSDRVEITRVRGISVVGTGGNPGYGTYYLEGRVAALAMTLSYHGEGAFRDLVGMVILKKQNLTTLAGVWCQYTTAGELRSGTTVWVRPATE